MRWEQKLLCLYQKSHLNPLFSSGFSELQERMKVRIGRSIPPQICLTTSKGTAKAQLDKACCGLVSVNLNVVTSYFANKNQYNFKMQTHCLESSSYFRVNESWQDSEIYIFLCLVEDAVIVDQSWESCESLAVSTVIFISHLLLQANTIKSFWEKKKNFRELWFNSKQNIFF